jgi:hypothetical protein
MDVPVPEKDYLRAFDDDLDGALALVIADLVVAGIGERQAEQLAWSAAQDRLDAVGPEAGGETALQVIDFLQDDIIYDRREAWPVCPEHGHHALVIELYDPTAMWTCRKSGRRFAKLGELSTITVDPDT